VIDLVSFHIHTYCLWIFWFLARNVENPWKPQNEFQWTTKHVFGKIISYTCDLCLKLTFWTHWILFFVRWLIEFFTFHPFPLNFQDFEILVWFGFSSNSSNEYVLSKKGACFCYKKNLESIEWFYAFLFIPLKKKCNLDIWYLISLQDSKWHLHNIQINFKFCKKFNKTSFYLLAYNNPLQL